MTKFFIHTHPYIYVCECEFRAHNPRLRSQFYYDIREATYTGQPTYQVLGNPNSTEVDIGFTLSNAEGKEMVLYIKAVDAAGNATEIQRRWTVARTTPV